LVLGGLSPSEPFAAVDVAAARASIAGGPPAADPVTGMIAAMVSAPGQDAASLLNVVEGLAQEPFDPPAKPPTVPTLFLAGQDDPMSQGIEQIAGLVPDARVQRVPGDHLGALASEEFRAAALDFLGLDQDRI
jgi:pimeloyl-ACP methyl ester carboxylesterase